MRLDLDRSPTHCLPVVTDAIRFCVLPPLTPKPPIFPSPRPLRKLEFLLSPTIFLPRSSKPNCFCTVWWFLLNRFTLNRETHAWFPLPFFIISLLTFFCQCSPTTAVPPSLFNFALPFAPSSFLYLPLNFTMVFPWIFPRSLMRYHFANSRHVIKTLPPPLGRPCLFGFLFLECPLFLILTCPFSIVTRIFLLQPCLLFLVCFLEPFLREVLKSSVKRPRLSPPF